MHNRGCHDFPSNVFSLILPKIFMGDPSLSAKNSGSEKISFRGISRFSVGGRLARFSVEYFFSQSTEIFVEEPSKFH